MLAVAVFGSTGWVLGFVFAPRHYAGSQEDVSNGLLLCVEGFAYFYESKFLLSNTLSSHAK